VWLWIALAFAGFYFGEAFLFWGPKPRVQAPPITPLLYWGAFGVLIVWLLARRATNDAANDATPTVPSGLQATVLGLGITVSVIGLTLLVMRVAGSVTLGHAVLLGTLAEAALVLGGMSVNLGWLVASLLWACGVCLVLRYPPLQDVTVGVAVCLGFTAVGTLRWSARTKNAQPASRLS
jgi:hypothetical protein